LLYICRLWVQSDRGLGVFLALPQAWHVWHYVRIMELANANESFTVLKPVYKVLFKLPVCVF